VGLEIDPWLGLLSTKDRAVFERERERERERDMIDFMGKNLSCLSKTVQIRSF
jgi:hypothetical protein